MQGRTDLACEGMDFPNGTPIHHFETTESGFRIEEVRGIFRGRGDAEERYATLHLGRIWEMDRGIRRKAAEITARILLSFLKQAEITAEQNGCILVAGLGNRFITPDSIGPRTAYHILITHSQAGEDTLAALLGCRPVCTLAPGVEGQTGMETAAILSAAAKACSASAVIAVDSLAARSAERLGTTLQIGDAGIRPGSGVGNHRTALNRETLGIPIIAVGIPTVVDSLTLLEEALHRLGMDSLPSPAREMQHFIVAPREIDIMVSSASELIAESLNLALNPRLMV
jgi:spore protease